MNTFAYCKSLTSVQLPANLVYIRSRAFELTNLEKIVIPEKVTSIADNAFNACSRLKEIRIPTKNTNALSGAPWGALIANLYWMDTIEDNFFLYSITQREITKYIGTEPNLVVPDSVSKDGSAYPVKGIGPAAFSGNKYLSTVSLGVGIV